MSVKEEDQEIKIIRPKINAAKQFPNIGMQDLVDLLDFFGFEVEFHLVPKEKPPTT